MLMEDMVPVVKMFACEGLGFFIYFLWLFNLMWKVEMINDTYEKEMKLYYKPSFIYNVYLLVIALLLTDDVKHFISKGLQRWHAIQLDNTQTHASKGVTKIKYKHRGWYDMFS